VLRSSDGPEGQPIVAVPEEVARIADVMSTYRPSWALAGGWAVDAWLGRITRYHQDVDLAVFDQPALFEHLAGWQLIGHEETKANEGAELWDGRALVPPAHLHGRSPEDSGPLPERFDDSGMRVVFPEDGFWLDVQLCERSGGEWLLNRDPRVAMPFAECIRQSGWGLPTVAPEAILFFKATLYVGTKNHLRRHDEADCVALLPLLSDGQREWLREAVSRVYVGEHPWVGRM
jgi:Aminoglycoside-2''-adenylyltransferase